ncbi:MAG: mannose-6-phosphate isomerase, class I [Micromonosporaceae bacterium]|nr:mannose-6-phosphate isomerase, class I [Micromonosporaceae bacterium]
MRRLTGRIRPYAWGSRTAIAELRGRAPSGGPEAELWYGAHPDDPSDLDGGKSLLSAIEGDPVGVLGEATVSDYGARLPFLFKVLAADAPLSIQAHPSAAQARAGFDAEEASGAPRGERNYTDPWHKPELLVAVSEFEALCGFRRTTESARLLAELDVPELAPVVARLGMPDPAEGLREAVTRLYATSPERRGDLVERVRAASAARSGHEHAVAAELGARYPGDIGVVVSLLLNLVSLRPGEAIHMPAGNLHTYLRGVGLEVMAASDNVLRGGLTPKRVDVPELLRVLRCEELLEPRIAAVPVAPDVVRWPSPAPDFQLLRAEVREGTLVRLASSPSPGPRVVFCLSGEVRAASDDGEVVLGPGEAGFARGGAGAVTLAGAGVAYQVSVGGA